MVKVLHYERGLNHMSESYSIPKVSHDGEQSRESQDQRNHNNNSRQQSGKIHTPLVPFALELGFFAGLIWGLLRWLFYTLHFTVVAPGFLAEPFFKHSFMNTTAGHLVGLLFFIALSVVASLVYTFMFRKWKGPMPGIVYGLVWWVIFFVLTGPKLGMMNPLHRLTWDSIYTEICVFVLWGLFIGYTVAVEYTDERMREPEKAGG
jgi:cation transport ATPase